jgi:hypothetical protein
VITNDVSDYMNLIAHIIFNHSVHWHLPKFPYMKSRLRGNYQRSAPSPRGVSCRNELRLLAPYNSTLIGKPDRLDHGCSTFLTILKDYFFFLPNTLITCLLLGLSARGRSCSVTCLHILTSHTLDVWLMKSAGHTKINYEVKDGDTIFVSYELTVERPWT